jgi:serine O-acetyltransferase
MSPTRRRILRTPRTIRVTPPSPAPSGAREWLRSFTEDVDAAVCHDPAARRRIEVILTYPGLHAVWLHRLAHALHRRELGLTARLLSHLNRFVTGVEIHPAARLGRRIFIDHGMGVVIGETAVVGDECLIYKGVVLGGTSLERTVRHPILGRGVVVGSNACILGAIEVGDGARVGSGSVVIRDVPEHATVVGVPGRTVSDGESISHATTLDHADLPDPVVDLLRDLTHKVEALSARVAELSAEGPEPEPAPEPRAQVAPNGSDAA